MKRMKLVFFVGANPARDAGRLADAYRFAAAANGAGLDAEVRLAGEAVLAADPAFVAAVPWADDLRGRIDAASKQGLDVSVCPTARERCGINHEQLAAIGARQRPLEDILVEVAEGRSVLVHCG